jgi:hypothetical protein
MESPPSSGQISAKQETSVQDFYNHKLENIKFSRILASKYLIEL